MTTERDKGLPWPKVDLTQVDEDWWEKVMSSTALYEEYFDDRLSNDEDFTIRALVHIVHNKPRKIIEEYLDGSQQLKRVLDIQRDLKSDDPNQRDLGRQEIIRMIEDYNKAILGEE